jgi:ATP/maltotriose-dependent transcriptional regulator MalT
MASPLVYRKRLINAINAPGHHVIYIYGPAGYGKTTLAKQWMESQDQPTAWVEGFSTSDAAQLFEEFLLEICRVAPHLTSKLHTLLEVRDVSIEHIVQLTQILESDKTPFNVVIDNAEEIRQIHNTLSLAIVRLMPRHIKLVLVTTTSPRSEFIQEAGINRFAVVNSEELKFNNLEIEQLAQEAIPGITHKEVERIAELTEGWPASTEIVTSLLRDNPDFRSQLSTLRLKGKHQFSIEANRVLAKLDEPQRTLLEQLSLLHIITPDVAYKITGNVDAVRQLTLLSQDSIVVSQVSQLPPKFKIHPIFRDALIDELRRGEDFGNKIEVVIEVLLSQSDIRQATSMLVEMGETPKLREILQDSQLLGAIGASIQDAITRSAINELRDWVTVSEHLPGSGSIGKAIISFYIEFLSGDFTSAESQINILEIEQTRLTKEQDKSWNADVLALKSLIAFARGRIEENWNKAIETYQANNSDTLATSRHQLTYLQFALWGAFITDDYSRVKKISTILDEVMATQQPASRNSIISSMRCLIAAHEGRLIETQNYLMTPISVVTHTQVSGFFGPFGTRFAEAILAAESGKLEESVSILQVNVDDGCSASNFPVAIASLGRQGYHLALLRRYEEALASIEKARELIRSHSISDEMSHVVDMWEIRVRHFMMDNDRVQELLKRCKPSYFVQSFQAAASIGTGNFANTEKIIKGFDLSIPRQAITYYLFKAYLLKDSPAAQLKAVAKAVDIGSKHGYFHHFVTQRSDILQQYISLASESPTAFNERLARAAGEELNKMMISQGQSGDALTRREADILRHLATGLPLKEIAKNLSISKNTIKTHLRNLYRKLGAEDRKDAVEKGKRLLKV